MLVLSPLTSMAATSAYVTEGEGNDIMYGSGGVARMIQCQHEFPKVTHMDTYDKSWSKTARSPMTQAEFLQVAGITPELEEFISDFVRRPEILDALSQKQQQEIEAQMDAVLALLC
jgi:hypothetical protein